MTVAQTFLDVLTETIDGQLNLSADSRGLVAVSGGADSVALLTGLVELARSRRWELVVAHLEHGIRGVESIADAEFVRELAGKLRLRHIGESADVTAVAEREKLSLEAAARKVRYEFLERVARKEGCDWVVTGHTADDNAETVAMNLLRGAGPAGIAGIPIERVIASGGRVRLVRPLLRHRRGLIEDYLRGRKQPWRTDHTNYDRKHLRNRIRHDFLPMLERHASSDGFDLIDRLNSLARMSGKLSEFLRTESSELADELHDYDGVTPGLKCERLCELPELLAGQMVRDILASLVGDLRKFERGHVSDVLKLARHGRAGTEIALVRGIRVYRDYDRVLFALGSLTMPTFEPVKLTVPGHVRLAEPAMHVSAEVQPRSGRTIAELLAGKDCWTEWLDAERIGTALNVRSRRPGDRFRPLGGPGMRKLQDFLTDRRLSRFRRDGWPLVTADDGRVVWVVGMGIADPFKVTGSTRKLLRLQARRLERKPESAKTLAGGKSEEPA